MSRQGAAPPPVAGDSRRWQIGGPADRCLADGCVALGLVVDEAMRTDLLSYLGLLDRWNAVFSLTAIVDPREMVVRLLLDSLSIVPYIRAPASVLDLGTGPGLPGVPLAIACPALTVTLLDSSRKKTRFLLQVLGSLASLQARVEVVTARAEQFRPTALFDLVVSRAVAPIDALASVATTLCRPGGRLLAMKGRAAVADEGRPLPSGWRRVGVEPLSVPGLSAERCLVILEREPGDVPD